ncbi:MAG: hypothetical protein VKN33_11190 [Candidatus Sericytochromatia bacterium]|nr:hypothetical protein [Candidatus Sericytochromatia bacterium]
MRRVLITGGLLITLLTQSPQAQAAAWLPVPTDKAAHFGVSYVLTDQLMRMGLRPEHAIMVTLVLGWVKEITDDHIDAGDLGADAAGSLAAAYLNWQFNW